MATHTLAIKDGYGNATQLSAYSGSYGLIPEHAVTGSVRVNAPAGDPVYVTGTVTVSQPINVDLVVGDNVFVSSSITAPLYVSSSVNSPLLVTGTVNINNLPSVTIVTSSVTNPLAVTGTVSVNNFPSVTTITASVGNPASITGTVNINNFPSITSVTASVENPVSITGSVYLLNSLLTVTSSNENPVVTKNILGYVVYRDLYDPLVGDEINYANATSGTFTIGNQDTSRTSLTVFNGGADNLYVSISNTGDSLGGFVLDSTASVPTNYSFIVYPSGTYKADVYTVNLRHSGFFVSSSMLNSKAFVTTVRL